MPIDITAQTRRVQYVISGTGPYDFDFEVLAQTDIAVYRDTTLLTLTTHYTVAVNADGTGSVTLLSATGSTLTIIGARPYRRITDYSTGGDFKASTMNAELDSFQIQILQLDERLDRTLHTSITDVDYPGQLPADRAGRFLAFDAQKNPIASAGTGSDTGLRTDLAATTGGTLIGYNSGETGAADTNVRAVLRRRKYLSDFKASGSGTDADPYLLDPTWVPVAGTHYSVDGVFLGPFPDFRKGKIWLDGDGFGSKLKAASAVSILTLDGGTVAPVVANYDFRISNLTLEGFVSGAAPLSPYAVDLRNMHRVLIEKINFVNFLTAAVRGRFMIGFGMYDLVSDVNGGNSTYQPVNGIVLDTDGVNGGCNAGVISNCNIRACSSYAIDAIYAQVCTFIGNQVESNDALSTPSVQLRLRSNSRANTIIGAYSNNEIRDDGVGNTFVGGSTANLRLAGALASVFGGKTDSITVLNSADYNRIIGAHYTTALTDSSVTGITVGVYKDDGTPFDDTGRGANVAPRQIGRIQPVAEELTGSGNFDGGTRHLQLNHATVAIVATWTGLAPVMGELFSIINTSASGTAAHSVKLSAGVTFDGTNNTVTLNAPDEQINGAFSSATRARVHSSVGSPAYSVT